MGEKLTTFENKCNVVLEIRVFKPPARPDHFRRIIRVKPGQKEEISLTDLCYNETNPERPAIIMVFIDGVYAGISLVPLDLVKYSKVICDRSYENGPVIVRGVKTRPGLWLLSRKEEILLRKRR
ncbi:hypothetical protein ACOSQ3_008408 [Xanthoceras sorbifolium]